MVLIGRNKREDEQIFWLALPFVVNLWYTNARRDGRVDYCGCLENSWVNRPGGSNPSLSASKALKPFYLLRSFCRMVNYCVSYRYVRAVKPAVSLAENREFFKDRATYHQARDTLG